MIKETCICGICGSDKYSCEDMEWDAPICKKHLGELYGNTLVVKWVMSEKEPPPIHKKVLYSNGAEIRYDYVYANEFMLVEPVWWADISLPEKGE